MSMRLRICGVRSASAFSRMSAMAAFSFTGVCANTISSFEEECPQLVDDGRASGDKPVAHSMDRLEIQLIIRLDRNKAHVLAFDGLRQSPPHRRSRSCWTSQTASRTGLGMSRTSWPCFRNARPRKCAPEQASKPINDVCMFAVYVSNWRCVNFFLTSTLPAAPSATR